MLAATLVALLGVPVGVAPATAAEGDPPYLDLTKTVTRTELVVGDEYTYEVLVSCSEQSCLDATLVDSLGDHAGHTLVDVSFQSSESSLTYDVEWTSGGITGPTAPTTIAADTRLAVDFTQPTTSPTGVGMQSGQTFTVRMTLKVPADLAPGTDATLTNSARVEATNSAPASATASVHVTVPVTVDVETGKTWSPASQAFAAGAPSTVRATARNASNVAVDRLVLQEPQQAPEGATTLAASNPFTIADLTAFSAPGLPAACAVTVDAYVLRDGAWTWVPGTGGLALPDGVAPADVAGLRVTCEGDLAVGTELALQLDLAQRAEHRVTGADLSLATHDVANVVVGTAQSDGAALVATDTANASHRVVPARLGTSVTKAFAPARVSAGEATSLTLTAANTSDVAVRELRITDLDFFGTDVHFNGFAAAPVWPTGATGASVVYHLAGGGTQEVPFDEGQVPAAPSGPDAVTGLELVFTGSIEPNGERARIELAVATDERTTGAARTYDNDATATVTATNGRTADATAEHTLTVVPASVEVALEKTILPGTVVSPGDRVVTGLAATLGVSSSYVTARELGITDAWDGEADDFWNAFDLSAVAPTQIPSDTGVAVALHTDDPDAWHLVHVGVARAEPWLLSLDGPELAAGLPGGVALSDVTGIRFILTNLDGFEENLTVTPYLVTTARGTLRDGSAVPTTSELSVTNSASVTANGTTDGGTIVVDQASDEAAARVRALPDGPGDVAVDKVWSEPTVPAQSGAQRTTTLRWRSGAGLDSVTITDPADPADVATTTYDAFDLVRVAPIPYSSTPFTNGWYLRYDDVVDVQLFAPDGAGGYAWRSVPAPASGWMTGTGFAGHTLTPVERAEARGVRLVLEPDDAARTAARTGPGADPYAPAPGTGVASASTDRSVVLTWQIRETRRSDGAWVTGKATYNTGDAGVVRNTVRVEGTRPDASVAVATDHADIVVMDATPLVRIDKSVSTGADLYVPRAGTVDPADWPTRTFTVTARNDSVARASYLRVTDPTCSDVAVAGTVCAVADPTADPFTPDVDWLAPGSTASVFDRFDLTDVRFTATLPAEVDQDASVVWLLRHLDGAYTSEQTTLRALLAMTTAQLADVVGVSVTYQGADPATTGGTISSANALTLALDVRLRTHLRSTGEPQELRAGQRVESVNHAYAQSYDPVLAPDVLASGTEGATVPLTGGAIDVAVQKTLSPDTVAEPARDEPVTVTLRVNQGSSSLAPAEVRLRDDAETSPRFWDEFDLVGLGAITLPAGADRVRVDVHGPFGPDGAPAWVEGEPAAPADLTLPVAADALADVDGVRFTYSRADGGFFSSAIPAPGWAAQADFQVRLRDTTRAAGEPIVLDGSDRTVENTVVVASDRLTGEVSQERTSAAVVNLFEGTHEISVTKLANQGVRTVKVGDAVPWDLTFRNTGTGFLTVTELRDALPPTLVWTGARPVVTTQAGGLMSDDVTVATDGDDIVLTWPADGRTMRPGEEVTVRLMLALEPGLGAGDRAVNTMTVTTAEVLDACSPLDASRPVTDAWAQDPTRCGATDHVSPQSGPNLFTVKGVRGSTGGATTPDGTVCSPSLTATGGSYYRTPCVAESVVDGVDDWVLRVVNGGTTDVEELVVFDQLSTPGDTMIISGGSRGSAYRPELVADSLQVTAPDGALVVTEVTTTPLPCVGTWAGLTTGEVCEQNGEAWQAAGSGTDWSAVTGLRVRVDLRPSVGGALRSGDVVDVTFSTRNVLANPTAPDGVPATPAADDVVAWNQFGVKYRDAGTPSWKKIAPGEVGVRVGTGAIEVRKVTDGGAVTFAPETFTAELTCSVGGLPLDLGAAAVVTLDAAGGHVARVDGLPVGTECDVVETGTPGSFGETTRDGVARVVVTEAGSAADPVPADQVATLTNTYAYSGLSVTKQVETEATAGDLGPFGFELTCTAAVTGAPVLFDGAERLEFVLRGGETFTAPADTIPAGATCLLRETDGGGADRVVLVGDGVRPTGDGEAEVQVGVDPASVTVTNGFDAGVLEVRKLVDGEGAALWGAGPFGFTAVCTYGGATVLDEDFTLAADASRTFGTFPVGTECQVAETASAGATRTALDPADGVVVIGAPAGDAVVGTAVVTATNTFDVTSIDVVKRVEGDTTVAGAGGPFTVELVCTWERDGERVPLEVPGGAERVLRAPTLTTTYGDLPVGSDCVLTETETGGADRVSATVLVDGAEPVASTGAEVAVVGLAGTTAPGQVRVELVNEFDAPPPAPEASSGTGTSSGTPSGGSLARTGGEQLVLAAIALGLLTAGGLFLAAARRRREV